MDRKSCKCGTYYRELINKSGLVVPVMSALAAFAVLFYVRFVGMFGYLGEVSEAGYWLAIASCVIGVILAVCFISVRIKEKALNASDTFLFACDFLMLFLLLGIIIFNFVSFDTLYYGVALIVVVALNVLRIKFSEPEITETSLKENAPNVSFRKYFGAVLTNYSFWYMAIAALVLLCGIKLSTVWGFSELFISDACYTAGLLIVAALSFGALAYAFTGRVLRREINTVDAFMMFAFFGVLVSGLLLIENFNVLRLILWLAALIIVFALLLVLARNTYIPEEVTDDSFFATQDSRNMVKGPKAYFSEFYNKLDLFALCAIAMFTFAICDVLTVTDVLTWSESHGFLLYSLLGLLLLAILGIFYVGGNLKSVKIGGYDALLAVIDVTLILLAVTIFADYGSDIVLSLIIWAVCLVICLAFSITRLFKVKAPAKIKEQAVKQFSDDDKKQDLDVEQPQDEDMPHVEESELKDNDAKKN